MATFVADFIAADQHTSTTERLALRMLAPFVNAPPFRWMVPGFIHRGFENYERRVMNEFMMGTDFFETLRYRQHESCLFRSLFRERGALREPAAEIPARA